MLRGSVSRNLALNLLEFGQGLSSLSRNRLESSTMNTDRLFLGLLPILFLGSVSHAEEIHEVEPNNSIKTATPVKAEQDIILRLKSKGDVDYFRLTVPKPGPQKKWAFRPFPGNHKPDFSRRVH